MRPTFSDPGLESQFKENGYVVVDAIQATDIIRLKESYYQLPFSNATAFESTMNNRSSEHKEKVHELIKPLVQDITGKFLNSYKPVIGNFVIKQPAEGSEVPAHQDWTMCDENKFAAVNIWIALDDVNEENGAIYILKQGTKLPPSVRGNFIPAAFDSSLFHDYKYLTPVFLKAGQALIYDLRCIHTSPPNRSSSPRFAAGCACIPSEATPIHHFFNTEKNTLETYKAPAEFYFNYSYGHNRIPGNAELISTEPDFKPVQFPLPIQYEILLQQDAPVKRIFKEIEDQKKYEEDGYLLIDFLDARQTEKLLQTFREETGWFEQGFMSSVYAGKEGYRQRADALLEPFGKKLVEQYLPGYDVIISTFMVKGSGEQSAMYPHQDWTLVDEKKHASFNIWIPLVNVDHVNGAMSIMRSGHRLPFSMRGSNVPDALEDKSQFTPEKLTYMPMNAGQALIYDHRCIHVSPPNKSGKIRPACAIGIIPKGVPVFHYFYDRPTQKLRRYKADKQFYFHHVATQFTAPEVAELIDEKPVEDFCMYTQEELAPFFNIQKPRKKGFWEKLLQK